MTDSAAVFVPGYRLTDSSTGEPISGATISFYNAGTTTPQTVYADKELLTALGTSVVTDALGCPTSDGVTKTDVFVGTASYKVVIQDASATIIETKDNRPGAVVSASSGSVSVTALFPVVTKSANYTILQADQNTTFAGNCSSGDITFTLPSAVPGTGTGNVSAAGWKIKIQHAGSANHVIIKVATGSGQSISGGVASSAGQLVLVRSGEDVELTSDGGNWRASSHTQASPHSYATGIIQIVSRLATSPGSPAAGDKYILTGTGGSWSTFAAGDIATWNGASWTNQTPPSNCGWRVYVQAENVYYSYISTTWTIEYAVGTQPGTVVLATQAIQEAITAGSYAVTPTTQKYHPSHPKAWGIVTVSGGVATLQGASVGIAGVVRNSTGNYSLTLSTAMSSTNYAVTATPGGAVPLVLTLSISSTTVFIVTTVNLSASATDVAVLYFAIFGDQ